MKKNFFAVAFTIGAATLASGLLSAPAKAQVTTGVPVTVTIPDVIYLETYSSLNFTPTLANVSTGTAIKNDQAGTNNFSSSTSLTGGGNIALNSSVTLQDVVLYKVWGLGGTNNEILHGVKIGAGNTGTLTKGSNGSAVGLTLADNSHTDTAPGVTYASAIDGTADLTFDFSNVKESGSHIGVTLTITATAQ